jgi:hypothetical protein
MIGKIAPKGKGFRGLAQYLLRRGRGRIVAGPMAGRTPRELAQEFGALRRLNPKLAKAVAHLMLSPAPGDPALTDQQWQAIAETYMQGMGYSDAPWCAVVHRDTDHQHLHLMACRIDFNGKTISEANDYRKSEAIVRRIEKEFGLVAVASPTGAKRKSKPKSTITTTEGGTTMTDTTTPPVNPFDPSHSQHATWPEPFEPGRDAAEMAIIEATPSIVVPGAYSPEAVTKEQQRKMRRCIVEDIYSQQIAALFGQEVTRVYRHAGGATLYFRGAGRIADRGHKLMAVGGMPVEMAAERIVLMAVSPPKCWKTISFTGSDDFVLHAMREAYKHRIDIVAVGPTQQEILARVIAERQGAVGIDAGPASGPANPTIAPDPVLAPLAELDQLPAQTLPRTAPDPKPVVSPAVSPPALPAAPPTPAEAPVVGVSPGYMNLRERLQERRQNRAPVKPEPSQSSAPHRPTGP